MSVQRYDLQRFGASAAMKPTENGQFVKADDFERVLSALSLLLGGPNLKEAIAIAEQVVDQYE